MGSGAGALRLLAGLSQALAKMFVLRILVFRLEGTRGVVINT